MTWSDPLHGHRYQRLRTLKQHGDNSVVLARDTCTGEPVAIKLISRGWSPAQTKYLAREVLVHRGLAAARHPHIVDWRGAFLTPTHLGLVTEYVDGEDLQVFLSNTGGRVSEPLARFLFQQLVLALDFCHAKGVASRDIKLSNTLLALAPGQLPLVKLADFGLAKDKALHSRPTTQVGSTLFVAPEVIHNFSGAAYDASSADVWSCGVILFIMLFGRHPFLRPEDTALPEQAQMLALFQRTAAGELVLAPGDAASISLPCQSLLTAMLQPDPAKRISLEGVQATPWFQSGLPEGAAAMNPTIIAEEAITPPDPALQSPEELLALVQAGETIDPAVLASRFSSAATVGAASTQPSAWSGPGGVSGVSGGASISATVEGPPSSSPLPVPAELVGLRQQYAAPSQASGVSPMGSPPVGASGMRPPKAVQWGATPAPLAAASGPAASPPSIMQHHHPAMFPSGLHQESIGSNRAPSSIFGGGSFGGFASSSTTGAAAAAGMAGGARSGVTAPLPGAPLSDGPPVRPPSMWHGSGSAPAVMGAPAQQQQQQQGVLAPSGYPVVSTAAAAGAGGTTSNGTGSGTAGQAVLPGMVVGNWQQQQYQQQQQQQGYGYQQPSSLPAGTSSSSYHSAGDVPSLPCGLSQQMGGLGLAQPQQQQQGYGQPQPWQQQQGMVPVSAPGPQGLSPSTELVELKTSDLDAFLTAAASPSGAAPAPTFAALGEMPSLQDVGGPLSAGTHPAVSGSADGTGTASGSSSQQQQQQQQQQGAASHSTPATPPNSHATGGSQPQPQQQRSAASPAANSSATSGSGAAAAAAAASALLPPSEYGLGGFMDLLQDECDLTPFLVGPEEDALLGPVLSSMSLDLAGMSQLLSGGGGDALLEGSPWHQICRAMSIKHSASSKRSGSAGQGGVGGIGSGFSGMLAGGAAGGGGGGGGLPQDGSGRSPLGPAATSS